MRQAFEDVPVLSALRLLVVIQTLFIALPSAIYCSIKLRRNWHAFFMRKRGTSLILLTFLVAAWGPLFEYPYYAIVALEDPHITYYTSYHEWISYPSMCSRLLEISFVTLRVYLLWFDHKHSDLMLSEGWRVLMDPQFEKTNWFFRSNNTFGNSQWMTRCIVFPSALLWCALWMAVHLYLRYVKSTSSSFIAGVQIQFSGIWLILHCFIGLWFWRRYSSFMDNLVCIVMMSY